MSRRFTKKIKKLKTNKMIKFTKSTLTEIAGLGAGAVAGSYVSQKVLTKTDETTKEVTYLIGTGATGKLIADLAPVAVGLLLQGQSNLFIKEAGKGMIAQAAGGYIKSQFPKLGITGDENYGGDTLLSGMDTGVDNPMISNVPSDDMEMSGFGSYGENGGEMSF